MTGKCGKAIQTLSRFIGSTPEAKSLLKGWNSVIQFDLFGEDPFYLEIANESAIFHEGKAETAPDVTLAGRSQSFFDVITGKIDADEAYMMKRYDVKGSVIDAMRFRRVSELTEQRHKTMFSLLKKVGGITFR